MQSTFISCTAPMTMPKPSSYDTIHTPAEHLIVSYNMGTTSRFQRLGPLSRRAPESSMFSLDQVLSPHGQVKPQISLRCASWAITSNASSAASPLLYGSKLAPFLNATLIYSLTIYTIA